MKLILFGALFILGTGMKIISRDGHHSSYRTEMKIDIFKHKKGLMERRKTMQLRQLLRQKWSRPHLNQN